MYTRQGPEVHREAYRMGNICLQNQGINGGIWNDLEELVADQRPDATSFHAALGGCLS